MKDNHTNSMLLHNFLQELNSISRMAIIENAFATEKMINLYSNMLKYRWHEEGKKVTAAKEMNIVLKCCELFKLKNELLLEYTYSEEADLTTVFIPHYTIIACFKSLLAANESMAKPFKLHMEVTQKDDAACICFFFKGQIDFKSAVEKVSTFGNQQGYEDFNEAVARWQKRFGEDTFKLKINEVSGKELEMCFICR